jgi:hypothetical protein
MNSIGGFLELELNSGEEYHPRAIRLNLGRTAFEYLLRAKKIKKVFLPFYTCNVLLEPLRRTGTDVEFYHINEKFEPVFDYQQLKEKEYFLYTNYYGIKGSFIKKLSDYISYLIIDNSQAFYSFPINSVDTFYSARKFFGLPDGGYLYTDTLLSEKLPKDISSGRFSHLLGRIEEGPEKSYSLFRENDNKLAQEPLKMMSEISQRLLKSINYKQVKEIRRKNFNLLAESLEKKNLLNIELESTEVPMVFPFLSDRDDLHELLIKENIYVATYWPEVLNKVPVGSVEYRFVKNLVPLPIDQRYGEKEILMIADKVLRYV